MEQSIEGYFNLLFFSLAAFDRKFKLYQIKVDNKRLFSLI